MRISKRSLDQMKLPDKDMFYWDDTLKGFGVKHYASGRKSFVLQGRLNGRVRRYTIGTYGSPWSPDQAREQALQYLSQLAQGIDPTAEAKAKKLQGNLAELAEQYLTEVVVRKKVKTQALEQSLIKRHILPLLGRKRVAAISKRDLQKYMIDVAAGKTAIDVKTISRGRAIVKGGKGSANRSMDILSAIFTFAIECGLCDDNPAKGIKKYRLKIHDRYLNNDELERLGNALKQAELDGASTFAIAAIRFMLLSGCRSGEALSLQWNWIDYEHNIAKLPDSKTGQKALLLGNGVIQLLKTLDRVEGSPLVFPSSVGGLKTISIQKIWRKVRVMASLDDLRLHDLRHNFASNAVSSGQSLYMVGKLLGHRQTQTTQRYAHLAPDPVRQAADDVSTRLAEKI